MRNGHVGEEWEGNTSIKGKFVALIRGSSQGTRKKGESELIKKEDGKGETLLGLSPRR